MKLSNRKMLLAPILAITLAFLLTGAIYYSPLPTTQTAPQYVVQASPQPTATDVPKPSTIPSTSVQSSDIGNTMQMPTPMPTSRPSTVPSPATTGDQSYYQGEPSAEAVTTAARSVPTELMPVIFIVAAVVVAILAVAVFFSERSLNKTD